MNVLLYHAEQDFLYGDSYESAEQEMISEDLPSSEGMQEKLPFVITLVPIHQRWLEN